MSAAQDLDPRYPHTVDGKRIDWLAATSAAEALLKVCRDSNYVAPDNGGTQAHYLSRAAACMNEIAAALKLGGGK